MCKHRGGLDEEEDGARRMHRAGQNNPHRVDTGRELSCGRCRSPLAKEDDLITKEFVKFSVQRANLMLAPILNLIELRSGS